MGHGLPAAGHDAVTELDDLGDANDLLGVIAFVGQQDQEEKDVRNNGLGLPRDRNALSDTSLSNPAARPTDTARRCSTWSASSHGGEALQLPTAPHSSGEGVRPGRHGRLSRAPPQSQLSATGVRHGVSALFLRRLVQPLRNGRTSLFGDDTPLPAQEEVPTPPIRHGELSLAQCVPASPRATASENGLSTEAKTRRSTS